MKHYILLLAILFCQIGVSQNILISNTNNPNEPSIMMDPNNPNILVAGSNLNQYYTSNDGGSTWTQNSLTSSLGVWGDPVIDIDTGGNFYFFHLSNPPSGNWIDRIVCQKSSDNGNTWTDGTFTGLNGTKAQDKHWSAIDPSSNNIYLTWTQFDEYGSNNPLDSSIILFSKSLDEGLTWSTPLRINKVAGDCTDDDTTVEGAVPTIGPNGELYVSWAGPEGIAFNRSLDQGDTWLSEDILIDPLPNGWNFNVPGIQRSNGLPVLKCDVSGGPNHGTLYINWGDQRNGANDTDIWLSKSEDGGDNWSSPVRVNNDTTTTHQFFSWMDIDQTNGNLHFVFYDRRNFSNSLTEVYRAVSTDGGITFENFIISDSPFFPNAGIFFGDYTNIVAHNDIVRPIWTRLDTSKLSIWTDISPYTNPPSSILSPNTISYSINQYPNPSANISYISFKLHALSTINITLYDQAGKLIHKAIENEKMDYGKYIIPIALDELNLSSGAYVIQLSINDEIATLQSIVIP